MKINNRNRVTTGFTKCKLNYTKFLCLFLKYRVINLILDSNSSNIHLTNGLPSNNANIVESSGLLNIDVLSKTLNLGMNIYPISFNLDPTISYFTQH